MCVGRPAPGRRRRRRVRAGRPPEGACSLGRPAGRRARAAAPAPGRVGHPPGRRRRAAARPRRSGARRPLSRRPAGPGRPRGRDGVAFARLGRGEVSEWLKVPLSKSGVRKHRGFESHPLRQLPHRRTPRSWPTHPTRGRRAGSPERSPRGLGRGTGNAVWGNPSWVRIPPSPPASPPTPAVSSRCRARRGTSGALYLQSAPAGLNPLPRPAFADANGAIGVEDRVPRSGDA